EHVRTANDAKAHIELSQKLIFVPDGERMMRRLADLKTLLGRCGRTRNERVLIGISAGHHPSREYETAQPELKSIGPLAARLDDRRRIVRIDRAGVGPVERKQR